MTDPISILERIYARFNERDIDAVLACLAPDVAWANGMDGGHVQGLDAVRAYWTRQWSMVSPHVEPVAFSMLEDGSVAAQVRQTVRDLEGRPLQGQSHGLKDKLVHHVFRFEDGKVIRFDIAEEND